MTDLQLDREALRVIALAAGDLSIRIQAANVAPGPETFKGIETAAEHIAQLAWMRMQDAENKALAIGHTANAEMGL